MEESIKKLELALKLMQERRLDVAGLGAPILLVKEAIEALTELDLKEFIKEKNSRYDKDIEIDYD